MGKCEETLAVNVTAAFVSCCDNFGKFVTSFVKPLFINCLLISSCEVYDNEDVGVDDDDNNNEGVDCDDDDEGVSII